MTTASYNTITETYKTKFITCYYTVNKSWTNASRWANVDDKKALEEVAEIIMMAAKTSNDPELEKAANEVMHCTEDARDVLLVWCGAA